MSPGSDPVAPPASHEPTPARSHAFIGLLLCGRHHLCCDLEHQDNELVYRIDTAGELARRHISDLIKHVVGVSGPG